MPIPGGGSSSVRRGHRVRLPLDRVARRSLSTPGYPRGVSEDRWRARGALLLCLLLTACSGKANEDATSQPTGPGASTALPTSSPVTPVCAAAPGTAPPRPKLDRTITIFLFCGPSSDSFSRALVRPVDRLVPDDGAPLRAALTQLLLGVSPDESAAGFRSSFSSYTAGQLRGATVERGIATLDLTSGFESTNNYSTSVLSAFVMGQIESTVFNFPEVQGIEFKIDGQRWCGWENVCDREPVPFRRRP